MVLQLCNDHGVTGLNSVFTGAIITESVRNKIERFGCILSECNLVLRCANEGCNLFACSLISIRCFLSKLVGTAVHGSVGVQNEVLFCTPHPLGALRCRT